MIDSCREALMPSLMLSTRRRVDADAVSYLN